MSPCVSTDATHVVVFVHPNSRMPTNYGTATVDDESDVDEILRQAMTTDPHHPEPGQEQIDAVREEATIYRVDGTVPTNPQGVTGA